MLLRVAEIHRIDHHADVGAVLPAHLAAGDVDHLDAVRVKLAHRAPVLSPVAVGALEHDAAFLEEALEHQIDAELSVLHLARTEREVLVVDEYGDQRFGRHGGSMGWGIPARGVLDESTKSRSPVDAGFGTALSGSEDYGGSVGSSVLARGIPDRSAKDRCSPAGSGLAGSGGQGLRVCSISQAAISGRSPAGARPPARRS